MRLPVAVPSGLLTQPLVICAMRAVTRIRVGPMPPLFHRDIPVDIPIAVRSVIHEKAQAGLDPSEALGLSPGGGLRDHLAGDICTAAFWTYHNITS